MTDNIKPIEILLVEDNPDDIFFTTETFRQYKLANNLHVVEDGAQAMDYLLRKGEYAEANKPDLIFLDLNLPKKSGHEILQEIKKDENLKSIPIVILTTSTSTDDILNSYNDQAACFITKPVDMSKILEILNSIDQMNLAIIKLDIKLD